MPHHGAVDVLQGDNLARVVACAIVRPKHESWCTLLYGISVLPSHSLILFKYPPILLAIVFSGISFSVIYFVNIAVSYLYSRPPYDISTVIVGNMYIPNSVLYFIASIFGGKWHDHLI